MKTNIKIIITLIIGITLSTTLSYCLADTLIDSKNVYYKDNSNLLADNVQDAIDGTCTKFDNNLTNLKKEIIKEMYPVGSIYISTSLDTKEKVGEALGGTWESYGAGRTIVGIGTGNDGTTSKTFNADETGGEYSHTLTIDEMPSHTHIQNAHTHTVGMYLSGYSGWPDAILPASYYAFPYNLAEYSGAQSLHGKYSMPAIGDTSASTATNQTTGGSKEHNNLQPYITVYMYKRVS